KKNTGDDDIINQVLPIFNPKQKYLGPSLSYVIEKDKKTPLHEVDLRKIKGPVTIEFTGGGISWLPEVSPGGGVALSSYWPPFLRFTASGWSAARMSLPGDPKDLVGMRLRVSCEIQGGEVTMRNDVQFQYLGRDQSWAAARNELKTLQGQWKG